MNALIVLALFALALSLVGWVCDVDGKRIPFDEETDQ